MGVKEGQQFPKLLGPDKKFIGPSLTPTFRYNKVSEKENHPSSETHEEYADILFKSIQQ